MRQNPESKTERSFHAKYSKWISSQPQITEDGWKALMEEDSQHPYNACPTSEQMSLTQPGQAVLLQNG